jgi:hypothetical protein
MTQIDRPEEDRRLAELWAADEPPARDPAFVLVSMERIERHKLWMNILALVPVTLGVTLLLWALAPVIEMIAKAALPHDASILGPLAGAAVMAFFLWSWASDRLQPLEA